MKHQISNPIMKQRGFTIIEVALVLAIAGLIFLVVFLALPALQNSQKDTARKQDVGRLISALQSYEADNNGNSPAGSSTAWYGTGGASSGFGAYYGKLSQITSVEVVQLTSTTTASYSLDSGASDWLKNNNSTAILVSDGLCPNDTGRTATTSDVAVYAALSSGTIYCASM
jgi:prepilin-type N-terminal cleavage/methylation domain-containing protein